MYDIDARFTVKSLKAVCQAIGLPISGTKGLLQQRLRNHFDHLVSKQDSIQYGIAKTTVESERGYPYGQPRQTRYDVNKGSGIDDSRPNGFHSSASPIATATPTTSQWGLSPLYQNIRLRTTPPCNAK